MKTPNINQILAKNPRSCRYGAPLGYRPHNESESPLYLQRVLMVDGDYATDGTYWGSLSGEPLWCAFNGEDCEKFAPAMGSRIFVRAKTRAQAIAEILDRWPDTKFKRGA